MILKGASVDLTFPNPTSAEFIGITPFIEENIPRFQKHILSFCVRNANCFYFG